MKTASNITLQLLALSLPLLLGACASARDSAPLLGSAYGDDVQQLLVTPESEGQLNVKGLGQVAIGRSYLAASGRNCRKLNKLDGTPLPLRSCQNGSGEWYTTRSISAPGQLRMPLSTASSDVPDESRETVGLKLKQGESLWAFSSRVTGNPLNWKQIAKQNNIDDADNVWPDQVLQVETSILKDAS